MKRSLAIVVGLGLLVLAGCRNDDRSSPPDAIGGSALPGAPAAAGTLAGGPWEVSKPGLETHAGRGSR